MTTENPFAKLAAQRASATAAPSVSESENPFAKLAAQRANANIEQLPDHNYSIGEAVATGAENLPSGLLQFTKDLGHAVAHPIDTLKGASNLVSGAQVAVGQKLAELAPEGSMLQKALQMGIPLGPTGLAPGVTRSKEELQPYADVVAKGAAQKAKTYTDWEEFKRQLAENPVSVLSDLSMVASGGASVAGKVAEGAEAGSTLSKVAGATARGLDTAATVTNPLSAPVKAVEYTVPKVGKAAQMLYRGTAEPFSKAGQEAIKSRAYAAALDNDPVKIQNAIQMFEGGKSIEEVATTLNSTGLAALAKESRNASTTVRDLYNAREALNAQEQINKLAGAQTSLNALKNQQAQGIAPEGAFKPESPLESVQSSLMSKGKVVQGKQLDLTKQIANVPPSESGAAITESVEGGRKLAKETVVSPEYDKAFKLAGDQPAINFDSVLGTASGQRAETLNQLKDLAPETKKILSTFSIPESRKIQNVITGKPVEVPAMVNLKQADDVVKALNIDIAKYQGTDSASNIARSNLMDLKRSVEGAIQNSDLPKEAIDTYANAKKLHASEVVEPFQTGKISNVLKTSTLNEQKLADSDVVETLLGSKEDTVQAIKALKKDPAGMENFKQGVESYYRDKVVNPSTNSVRPNAHDEFMATHSEQLKALDDAGMGMRDRLEGIGNQAKQFSSEDAALKLKARALKYPDTDSMRTAIMRDSGKMKAALEEMDSPAKASLSRSTLQDAIAQGPEYIASNEKALRSILKASHPEKADNILTDAKRMADLSKTIEAQSNVLGKDDFSNLLASSARMEDIMGKLPKGQDEIKAVIRGIQKDIANGKKFDELAAQGKAIGSPKALGLASESIGSAPTFLNHAVSIFNLIMNRTKGLLNDKLAAEIAGELMNSETATQALSTAAKRAAKMKSVTDTATGINNALVKGSRSPITLGIQKTQNALGGVNNGSNRD